jgi:hypothetical protein
VSDAQTWTLIAGFFALMVSTVSALIGLTLRTVRADIGGLRAEMGARFDAVDVRMDHLDRDVQAVVSRLMEP